jgi:hypothetical protein
MLSAGTSGQVLTSNGASAPTWTTISTTAISNSTSTVNVTGASGPILANISGATIANITSAGITVTGNLTVNGFTTLQQTTELMVSPTFASTITCDLTTGAIFYISPTSNFTVNITKVPTTINRTIVVTLILSQSTTGYYANAVQIDGVAQTIKWSNNVTLLPTANKTEIETITLIRTSGGSWVVLGDYSTYG